MSNDPISVPQLHEIQANGTRLAYWEWHAERRGEVPTLLLVHATGFHGRVWDEMIRHLPPWHIVALEQRGHGRSEKRPMTNWVDFGEDLADVLRRLDLRPALAIGHSMGGNALIQAVVLEPGRIARMLLCDPLVLRPEAYESTPQVSSFANPASKRQNHFDSPEAMMARFRDRMPYAVWKPECLRDYCVHGLLPDPQGPGFVLACPPATEAHVYQTSRVDIGIFETIGKVDIPVLVLRAKPPTNDAKVPDFGVSPTWPQIAAAFPQGRDLQWTEHTHLIPMQDPEGVAALVRAEMDLALQGGR